jgi:predicted Fe-Mo cluster-binding NifX family protein
MTTRIVIPVEDENGLESHVAQHFGRAPYFAVVDLENGQLTNITIQPNTSEHTGGIGSPHDNLLALKPNAIVVFGMGPRGLQSFQNSNITVLKADSDHVSDIVESFKAGKLAELNTGCEHAHHHD